MLGGGPAVQTRDELLTRRVDQQNAADVPAHLAGELVEGFGLRDRSRKSVEQHARRRRYVLKLGAHHANGHVVGNVLATLEVPLHATAEIGLAADVVAENFAGRELHPAVLVSERLRLRALPRPGGADDDEVATAVAEAGCLRGGHGLGH